MRHIAIAAAAAAALLSTSAFAAGVPATIKQQNATISSVNVQASQPSALHRYKANSRELATQFSGTYRLTNGSEIELTSRNSRFYATMDGAPIEMLSVSRNSYVSADSKLAVSFDSQATRGDDIAVSFVR